MFYIYIPMKYLIAHRGNVNGPNSQRENEPAYIMEAIEQGFDVEIDVWVINNKIYLGHDAPQYETTLDFLCNPRFWCHAKNHAALTLLIQHKDKIHCFSHNTDDYVLTSHAIIWAYSGKPINPDTICVMPENGSYSNAELMSCLGICSDFVASFKSPF